MNKKYKKFNDDELKIINQCIDKYNTKSEAIDAARIRIFRELNIERNSVAVRDKVYSLGRVNTPKIKTENKIESKVIINSNNKIKFIHEVTMGLSEQDKLDLITKLYNSI